MTKTNQPSITKNYLYNVLYEIFVLIIPFITATYTARVFEADGIGAYSFSNTIASYAVLIGSLGVASYGQRECARFRDDKIMLSRSFWEIFLLKSFSVIICLVIYLIPTFFLVQYSSYLKAFICLVVAAIFDISWFYRGVENFKLVAIWQIVIKLITIIGLFLFIKEKSDLSLYILFISLSTLFGNIMMWISLKKFVDIPNFRKINPLRHLKNTLVYFIPTIATSIYTQLDKLMIGWISKDDFENGYYEQATKIVSMCKSIILTINTVIGARMSYLFQHNKFDEIKKRLLETMNYILLISVPICLGLIAIANVFVPVFFGEGYDKVTVLIYILAPLLISVGISNILGACYFIPSGQRARSNKIIVSAAFINFILNIPLIFMFKSIGACIASLIAETFIAVAYLIMGKEWLPVKAVGSMLIKKVLSGLIMFALVWTYSFYHSISIVNLIIEIFIGILSYTIFTLILKDKALLTIFNKIFDIFGRKQHD